MWFQRMIFWVWALLIPMGWLNAVILDTYKDLSKPDFYLTLYPGGVSGEGPVWPAFEQKDYMRGFLKTPHIGHYDATGNYLSPFYAMIQHANCLDEVLAASSSLKGPLKEIFHVSSDEELAQSFKKAECYIIVSGRPRRFEEESLSVTVYESTRYNVMLHPWALGQYAPSKNITVGLFDPVAILACPGRNLSVGRLSVESLHLHPAGSEGIAAWSPDNMRLAIEKPEFSGFWILAEYEGRVLVLYQIMVTSEEMEIAFEEMGRACMTLREWLDSAKLLLDRTDEAVAIKETLGKLFPDR